MKSYREKIVVRCKTHVVPIPKTREPFVNTPLLSLGSDDSGLERFWISTWNSAFGTTCVVVNEMGEHRILRPGIPHWGFYSAAMEDADTLWLCGDLSRVVRLKISSGRFETFRTGAPPALVFQGMVFDAETGKRNPLVTRGIGGYLSWLDGRGGDKGRGQDFRRGGRGRTGGRRRGGRHAS